MAASVLPPAVGAIRRALAVQDRIDGRLLQGPKRPPLQRVDDVVLDRGVESLKAHRGSSISSRTDPRSASVISVVEIVSS